MTHRDFDPHRIILAPLSTEKSIRQIEFNNKLTLIVAPAVSKREVKEAVEMLFKTKVAKVNLYNSPRGQRKAYVKLVSAAAAADISADLGLI